MRSYRKVVLTAG